MSTPDLDTHHLARIREQMLGTALEAIGSAALFVDGASGRIQEANAAARKRLATEGRALRIELALAARRSKHPKWSVTPVQLGAGSASALLVARSTPDVRARVQLAAARWQLTPRQQQVLAEIASGRPNRSVAAVLEMSERTVEVHVTALLEKAQVESRAELIVAVLTTA